MSNVYLDLDFKFPSLSLYGSAYVMPRMCTRDEAGRIHLTPECASIEELEANVAILRADLNAIVAEARKRFAKAKAAGPQPLFAKNSN
jgi:hypothetical protein